MLNQETAKAARTDSGYILRAPRRMRVADAVAQYMRVPMGAGNSVPWDPLVAPYVIEPMNCLASREYDAVIFVGPARTGKTIGLIDGWVIYNVICDPADMLIIQMTEEKAREHSKKRLARTFRVSPEVVSRLSPNKNDNNVYDRTFLAGNYLKIGWPSVNIMSSSDYKCVALTDYDRFPEDIDGEGDAFSLASKRTTTFMSSGMTLVESSPGRDVKDVKWRRTSPHEAPPTTGILSLYNRGDRRRWYWPCPHCGEYFQPCGDVVAGFRDIADPVLASEAAYIQCPSCSGRIMPEQKRELNGRGVWLRDGESINADGSRYGEPRRSRIASFWMEGPAAAYQTLSQLVYKLLTAEQEYEATGSEETLKTVINTDWGLPYLPRASMEQRKSELLEQRAEGNTNISGVTVVFRAGEQEQTPPEGFESSGSETVLGTEVKYDTPITRTITSTNIDRLRFTFGVQALVETTSKGDRNPSEVRLLVQIQRNGGWVTEKDITIKGKTTSQYLASVVVDNLPPRPFNIRMRRMTPDSTTDQLQNKTLWSSYTEIIDVKQCYPNTALVGVQVDSEQFGSQQVSRNYHLRGRILQVPSNYNPQTRQYSGIWDGTFKPAYSDNMAWCLWDMLTHPRYGMGKRLGAADVDKWALYVIGQYCDQSVPDGFGGTEPRITCNA